MLKRRLERRIGAVGVPTAYLARIWAAALVPAISIFTVTGRYPGLSDSFVGAGGLLAAFGVGYLVLAVLLRVDEVSELVRRKVLRRL